jgi:hypothetical protein
MTKPTFSVAGLLAIEVDPVCLPILATRSVVTQLIMQSSPRVQGQELVTLDPGRDEVLTCDHKVAASGMCI